MTTLLGKLNIFLKLFYNWYIATDLGEKKVSLQFSRSLRSLKADSFRASRIGLILAIIFVFALLIWFFFAKVTLYEISSSIELTSDGRIMAQFSEEAAKRINVGQTAILRLEGKTDQQKLTLPALVVDTSQKEKIEVLPLTTSLPEEFEMDTLKGQVDVEVEYVKPVEMVLRTSGNFMDQSKIPVSPQSYQEERK